MKLIYLALFALPLLLPAADQPALRAGAAGVDITPREFPLNMPGGFTANLATNAHDPLHARALVLADGATTLALVVVDNLGVAPEVQDEAKDRAATRTGIAPDKLLIASTHSHSAPSSNTKTGPAPAQHQPGGYETWLGTNTVQEDTSVILTQHLLEMLALLAKEK